ncbi:alpha/beta-hydrolase [Cylindrobasidium torrendii FP15055 ss-10]|uniref:Alpha/beta-hydrolase n=1 Tax=Cylindrobasidium torrendii FP15055 ss-10 TaxID=1314674 RepID=A0A0D7BH97_9AGAR|nr:alpha/beta-hydrolase [Cylindrobasidium torrendii FP15055 ss-10]
MLSTQAYTFDPRPDVPLALAVNRYWQADSPHANDPEAFTLVLAHATGFSKELWEPVIEDLYAAGGLKIRDIWAVDAPNHGDSYIVNHAELSWGYPVVRWEDYGRSIHAMIAGLGSGIDVDFSKRRVVAIGHSMGAGAFLLTTTLQPRLRYESLILIEPMILNQEGLGGVTFLAKGAVNRRDIWASKEEAYTLMKARKPWKFFDDRVLKLYITHGLTSLPTAEYPDKTEGVTLKTPRRQEVACFSDPNAAPRSYNIIGQMAQRLPIHMVYGGVDDYIPLKYQKDVTDNAAQGRLASITRIPGAGHLAVQTHPTAVAHTLVDLINKSDSKAKPKL